MEEGRGGRGDSRSVGLTPALRHTALWELQVELRGHRSQGEKEMEKERERERLLENDKKEDETRFRRQSEAPRVAVNGLNYICGQLRHIEFISHIN